MMIDAQGKILFGNQGSEALMTAWKVSLHEKIPPEWREIVHQVVLSKTPQTLEMTCDNKSYILDVIPLRGNNVNIYGTEVTQIKDLEKQLMLRETIDQATQLPNRIAFIESLSELTDKSQKQARFSVIVLRIDDFSQLVYTYGQDIANHALQELVSRVKAALTEKMTMARIRENEFAIIKDKMVSPSQLATFLENIIKVCTQPYQVKQKTITLSISAGITMYPNDGLTPEVLARNAQLAVNRTSETKSAFEFFQRGMDEQIQIKREMVADLHDAIAQNQLEVHYQPQIDMKTFEIIGCEALVRWKHPTKGFVSPVFFIPAAEEGSLILPIGEWILREACRQISIWRLSFQKPIKVSVNLSARQVLKSDICDIIKNIVDEYEITPEWLAFELTESAVVEDKSRAVNVMQNIKKMGFKLLIDDFGTGYSSLSYLLEFPIDFIKVDRSFVKIIEHPDQNYAVTNSIIDLGHQMKLRIIAEGVETQPQWAYLEKQGCDIVQGYIVSKPVPALEFNELMSKPWKDILS